ncbi:putative LPS assembly protein LptD [Fluviicola taffensis]|uniref:putative LPS assembly protein LptD n=1 Tax=Fluviicola taffensis TaxID=191579 RepID=UPI0031379C7B
METKKGFFLILSAAIRTCFYLLICVSTSFAFGQKGKEDSTNSDGYRKRKVYINDTDFKSIITYSARDSIYSDLKKKQVHLYGEAKLNYEGVDMSAEYLLIDLNKNEVLATFVLDSLGRKVGKPLFVDNGDTLKAASIRYNFETKKGYIQEAAIKQDDYYLTMEKAKRQPNEDVHFIHGKFTTCNLEEPHYHFGLSKAVMIPDKRIVSGPINLWVMGVPTPLGLPFAMIPLKKKKDRQSGFIMPQYSIISAYGMGLQDLGYYIPISERFQTIAYVTGFTRGSFGFRNYSEYATKYKYNGNFDLGYTRFRYGYPDSTVFSTTTIRWTHNQDPKLNPNWSFTANVNYNSNSTNKQTLNQQNNPQYFNNTLNSDIKLGKRFGSLPISADLKLSLRQNSATKIIDLTSPIFNFQTTNRIFPFKRVNKVVGFSYANEIQNRSSFKDRYLKNGNFDSIGQNFRNGITQNFNVQATFSILKNTVRITPSATYKQIYNFQSIVKTAVDTSDLADVVHIDTIGTGGFSHSFSSSVSLTSNLYSYYRFVGKRKTLLRHVMTPTVSFNYAPTIQQGIQSYTDTINNVATEVRYSKFERSLYSEFQTQSSGRIVFGLNNTFEIKQKSEKDTITGFKKTRLIDNFFLSTDYDIFKDSMNWGDLNMRMVINPNEFINLTITANHSWYGWDSLGRIKREYALKTNQGIGRIKSASFATSLVLTTKKSRDRLQKISNTMSNVWNPEYQQWILNPNQMVYFEIPWKLTVDHIFSLNLNGDTATYRNKRYLPTNTVTLSGDVNLTPNWKVGARMMYDIEQKAISNFNINLYRNIHCWNVVFNWTPIGTNKSFTVGIKGNASILQNANINIRKPPIVLN